MNSRNGADTSLIITTYNWPLALRAVLESVRRQQVLPREVLIADDGSGAETRELIQGLKPDFPCELRHVWHPDEGYQVARIRNRAAEQSTGDYLIFIDGDCLLRSDFVSQHLALRRPSHFVAGNRVLLTPDYTDEVLSRGQDITALAPFEFSRQNLNRRWSLLRLPLGWLRHTLPWRWKGVMTCNLSLYRKDFVTVNGFEEEFTGWGYEDSDLAVRLHHLGVRRISGRFAVTVIHLWHRTNKSALEESNWARLQDTIASDRVRADQGMVKQTPQR